MIVTCERCETQFQLDESRVPATGARVRCSRCKHAFVVHPPAAADEDPVHRAASQALAAGETPDATRDLPDENEESDWKFADERAAASDDASSFGVLGPGDSLSLASDDDEPAPRLVSEPEAALPAARKPAQKAATPAPGARRDAADELGSPDEWNIFDDPAAGPRSPSLEAPAAPVGIFVAVDDAETEPPISRILRIASVGGGAWLRRGGAAAGWLATAALCAIGFARGLSSPIEGTPAAMTPVAGIALEDVRGRWVENARLGKLFVVSGTLRRTGDAVAAMPPLELVLRDAAGAELEPTRRLDAPRSPGVLRDAEADALHARRSAFAQPLRPGESRPFEVVAWPLPREAARFEIRSVGGSS